MKKVITILIFSIFFLLSKNIFPQEKLNQIKDSYTYRQEFLSFKKSDPYKLIFDRYLNSPVKNIQRDIENYKKIRLYQRLIRTIFLAQNSIVITQETMPKFYVYIDRMCKEHNIKTPTIFVTTKKGFFNAFAQKLLVSSGAILIGQDLFLKTSDEELEAIAAHEIGHIKYNHVNKIIFTCLGLNIGSIIAANQFKFFKFMSQKEQDTIRGTCCFLSSLTTLIITGKKFERQADAFAYKEMGKGKGIINFFTNSQNKEKQKEVDFQQTKARLKKNYANLTFEDYYYLRMRYTCRRFLNTLNKARRWIHHHTPLGAHPSDEKRIEAAQKYLASQEA